MSGHFTHGKNMVCWQQCTSTKCPQCGNTVEDKVHIVKCTHEQVNTKWNEAILDLTKWMKETNSAPHLITAMENGLQAWQQDNAVSDKSLASLQQSTIRWDAALDGWHGMASATRSILVPMA